MIDLHIGITAAGHTLLDSVNFMPVTDVDGYSPEVIDFREDGRTSWEQWYEAPWEFEDGMEAGSHTIIRCASIGSALENLGWLIQEGFELVPMRFEFQTDVIASITNADDWSELHLSIRVGNQGNPTGEPASGFTQPKE